MLEGPQGAGGLELEGLGLEGWKKVAKARTCSVPFHQRGLEGWTVGGLRAGGAGGLEGLAGLRAWGLNQELFCFARTRACARPFHQSKTGGQDGWLEGWRLEGWRGLALLEGWRFGGLEGCSQSGGLASWRAGGLEAWRLEGWRGLALVGWRAGGLEGWRAALSLAGWQEGAGAGGLEGWSGGLQSVWRAGWRAGGLEGWRAAGCGGAAGGGTNDTWEDRTSSLWCLPQQEPALYHFTKTRT